MGIQFKGPEPKRNDLCPCNSGLKFKFCHGDPGKIAACERVAFEHMALLVAREQHKHGIISDDYYNEFIARYNPKIAKKPVTEKDVNELIASTGLTRCASCGTPIPDNEKLCVICKRKGLEEY